MSDYYIYHDRERCIGCYACEVHCKSEKDVPVGPKLNAIIPVDTADEDGPPGTTFVYMHCYHCEKAACVTVCPTGAMKKRSGDGIVFVEDALCIGCKSCISACHWGVPQWDAERGKILKCDYCMERLDRGLQPACVTKCTARALKWMTPAESTRLRRERIAKEMAGKG